MYELYFAKRLLEALALAEEATDAKERSIHLRASEYYCDLLQLPEQRRGIRHFVKLKALLHHAYPTPRMVMVSDLSSTGFRVELPGPVERGTIVALQLEGLTPADAYVVWQDGDEAGCKFLSTPHPTLLEAALLLSPHVQ
jgi:hypothetical protein